MDAMYVENNLSHGLRWESIWKLTQERKNVNVKFVVNDSFSLSLLAMPGKTYSREKNYECNVCGKRFSQSSNLVLHMIWFNLFHIQNSILDDNSHWGEESWMQYMPGKVYYSWCVKESYDYSYWREKVWVQCMLEKFYLQTQHI